jgi:hypothetical protein
MSNNEQPAFDAAFWFQWIMATTLGWILGSLIFPVLSTVSAGVGVGLLQWPVLYRRLPRAWRWPLATAIAWTGGSVVLLVAVPDSLQLLLSGLILGCVVGLGQWWILRREFYWAGWWIVISPIAWISGLTILPGFLSTGSIAGAISGIALTLLLHTPRPASVPEQANQEKGATW